MIASSSWAGSLQMMPLAPKASASFTKSGRASDQDEE